MLAESEREVAVGAGAATVAPEPVPRRVIPPRSELGAKLKQRWPTLRVLILTMHADDRAILRSLGAGLDGYLLKDSEPRESRQLLIDDDAAENFAADHPDPDLVAGRADPVSLPDAPIAGQE